MILGEDPGKFIIGIPSKTLPSCIKEKKSFKKPIINKDGQSSLSMPGNTKAKRCNGALDMLFNNSKRTPISESEQFVSKGKALIS
ncbi:hypothetical protein BB560_002387 [Smittium megazygosporum]|uniref:Uncharacterized protein n=1 Tax=Smittium megazygosporum TaxID=133381 RepID=A0A2T9ZEY1_9FUNG|nr:hypothetical protein BB560_002387 [Smittium megazygosporum]